MWANLFVVARIFWNPNFRCPYWISKEIILKDIAGQWLDQGQDWEDKTPNSEWYLNI
jgi:hypothetical protein